MLRAGEVFAGYVIKRELGRGGTGAVYLARHPRLPRLVALKLLSSNLDPDNESRARFEREADLAAQLDHPNIVTVFDRGVEEGQPWISMQYVDGIAAAALDPRALPPDQAVAIIAETATALDYAHAIGVLHRDVKPANILLAQASAGHGPRTLLTDFGTARSLDDARQLTEPGVVTATLAYASPEQLAAVPVDHRSDLYSLACTLFWLLTGSTPFAAESTAAIIDGHMRRPPPRLSSRRPGLPTAMDAVFATALAKNPDERFRTATEFACAVRQAMTSGAEPPRRRTGRRSLRYAGIGGLVLAVVLAIAVGIVVFEPSRPSSAPPLTHSGPIRPLVQLDARGRPLDAVEPVVSPAGDGKATCAPIAIAAATPVSGQNSGLGIAVSGGVKLAVDRFTRANPGCHVSVLQFDTTSDQQAAARIAPQVVNDPSVIAVIGPVWASEIRTAGPVFAAAEVPLLTPSSTSESLSRLGLRTFFRGLAASNVQPAAMARYLVDTAGFRKICVVKDNTGYGSDLAKAVGAGLGTAAELSCAADVAVGDRDFALTVNKIAAAAPDAVFYAGSYPEAAELVKQLRQAGVTAAFAAVDATNHPDFVTRAGTAARGAILSCACGPRDDQFIRDYQALNGTAPGAYAAEGYDLTTIVLSGIAAGRTTRRNMMDYLRGYDGQGMTRAYRWNDTGELVTQGVWLYRVE